MSKFFFFADDPIYVGKGPQQQQPQQVQGFFNSLVSGFGLFTPPAPAYKPAPIDTSKQLPPPTAGGSSSAGTSTGAGQGGSVTPTPIAGACLTASAEIECPSIPKEDEERQGKPVEFPWPTWATRYRVQAFSPVYSGHDDDRKEPETRKHRLNATPVGINIPARAELEAGATPPPALVIIPTWQCITGTVKEGNLYAVLSVIFEGPSPMPKGSN
jgi:hypothetical protein